MKKNINVRSIECIASNLEIIGLFSELTVSEYCDVSDKERINYLENRLSCISISTLDLAEQLQQITNEMG